MTLKGMTGGGTTTPDTHDGRMQQGKTKTTTNHITIQSFTLARHEEEAAVVEAPMSPEVEKTGGLKFPCLIS